jgi:hypothetical protein
MTLAPIVLFVYNRPWHTQQTIKALQKNELADQSDLVIYSDAYKNDQDWSSVQQVRDYIKIIKGFKSVKVVEREDNWGLAKSIIAGVTEVVNQYGKIIVLEDDIVTSSTFLSLMNQALDRYRNEPKVWHISGWNYPIDSDNLGDFFFWRVMNCWGWATWADRWAKYEKSPRKLINEWSAQQKHHFDLDGSGVFWHQVIGNTEGKMNTWAIFWYATIYQNKGLCLTPTSTHVDNIGHDGSGVHCGNSQTNNAEKTVLNTKHQLVWPVEYKESALAVEEIKLYYRKQKKILFVRIINKLTRIFIGRNVL